MQPTSRLASLKCQNLSVVVTGHAMELVMEVVVMEVVVMVVSKTWHMSETYCT